MTAADGEQWKTSVKSLSATRHKEDTCVSIKLSSKSFFQTLFNANTFPCFDIPN